MHHLHQLLKGMWTNSCCATCSGEGLSRNGLCKDRLGFLRVCFRNRLPCVLVGLGRVIDRAEIAASAGRKRLPRVATTSPCLRRCLPTSAAHPSPRCTPRLCGASHHSPAPPRHLQRESAVHLAHVEPHAHVCSNAHGLGPKVLHPAAVRLVEGDLVRMLVRHVRLERLRAHRASRASVEKELVVARLKCRTAAPSVPLARILASERKKRSRTHLPGDRRNCP